MAPVARSHARGATRESAGGEVPARTGPREMASAPVIRVGGEKPATPALRATRRGPEGAVVNWVRWGVGATLRGPFCVTPGIFALTRACAWPLPVLWEVKGAVVVMTDRPVTLN